MSTCPQCESKQCGDYACRFSGITHALFRENNYANAAVKSDRSARYEGRPDHDTSCGGLPLKPGT